MASAVTVSFNLGSANTVGGKRYEAYVKNATAEGLTVSEWLRRVADKAAGFKPDAK